MKKGKTIRGKSTLRQRIILCMGLCVGLCLLLLTAFFYTVVRMMEENRVQAAMESNVQSLSASFDDSYYFLLQISQQMTPEGNVGTIAEDLWQSQEAYDRIQYGKQLSSSVSIMMFASTDVTMVAYYRQEDGEGAQPWFSTFPERDAFQIEDQPVLLQTNELTFHGLHRSQNRFVDKNVVSVCRPIEFHTGDRFLIYVELYSTVLDTLDQAARTQEMEYTLIQLDDKQEIRYSSSGAFPVGDSLELAEQGQITVAEDRAGKKYVCLLKQGRFGYHTAMLAPLEQYSGEVWFWTGSLILMVLLVTAAVVISLVLVSRLIYRPMHLLEQEIEQVGKGDLSMSHHGSLNIQEFDVLFERIQVMKQEISGLMDDIREQEQEKQKLELSNLYYQINPHFLMNALNSVHWMAVTRGQKEIDSFIYYLNYILGYSLGKTNRKATFRTELQSLEAYLELQKMRYDFKTEFQVEQGDYGGAGVSQVPQRGPGGGGPVHAGAFWDGLYPESRKLYPELQYVVLSFHESFEYVQGAMRLGAIDYISKLRLEQEDCKEVFLRVARLLGCREGERPAEEGVPSQTLEELRQSWESLQWVYDDIRFQEQGERLEKLGVSPRQAERLAAWTATALETAFGRHFPLPDRFNSMQECLRWLGEIRLSLHLQEEGDGGIPSCMLRAVLYIKEHLREPLKAELVAEAVGMSRGYFSTTFKKHTGLTFNDYVRRQRVFLAQELLEQGTVLPGDVSVEVGYEDSKYFGRIFQEQTGMTCSAYWKQMSQGRKK